MIQHQLQRRGEFDANKFTKKYGFKPIEIAALNGRNEIFRLLLKNGARINFETLKNAVVGGHLETVKMVVDNWHGSPNTEEDLQGLEMRQRQHMNVDELRNRGEESEKIVEFLEMRQRQHMNVGELRNRGEESEKIVEFLGLSNEFQQNRNSPS